MFLHAPDSMFHALAPVFRSFLVYGTVTLTVIDAVIGMGMAVVVGMELILGQLVLFSVEVDELSWTLETVFSLMELFMLTWMEIR